MEVYKQKNDMCLPWFLKVTTIKLSIYFKKIGYTSIHISFWFFSYTDNYTHRSTLSFNFGQLSISTPIELIHFLTNIVINFCTITRPHTSLIIRLVSNFDHKKCCN